MRYLIAVIVLLGVVALGAVIYSQIEQGERQADKELRK